MAGASGRALFWAPRGLALGFAAFLGLFALDVFEEGRGAGEIALALLVHLLPTWLVLGALFAAWRRPWIGALLFPALAAFYVAWAWGRPFASLPAFALIAGPPAAIGILFLLEARREASPRP